MGVRLEVYDLGDCIVTDVAGRTHWLREGVAFATQIFEDGVVHFGYRSSLASDERLALRVERAEISRLRLAGLARRRRLHIEETRDCRDPYRPRVSRDRL
jgi:hypothetical protein